MYYTSYAANTGTWFQWYGLSYASAAGAAACQFGITYPDTQTNGVMFMLSSIPLAGVTDGTSNTLLASERAHGRFPAADLYCWNWWTSGNYGDTLFTSFFPISPFNKIPDFCCLDSGPDAYVASAASFHPGGANFAFCDGSVKFLKDSIDTMPYDPVYGFPTGITSGYFGAPYTLAPGAKIGVYQQLSTRNGGEVIGSDAY
jgi:prepilin-type processing-associated H-X9-DG protein